MLTRLLKIASFSLCFVLVAMKPAFAELPFVTDDPEVVDYQHAELFFFATKFRSETETQIAFPSIEYNYGLLKSLELSILAGILTTEPKSAGEPNATGLTDTQISLKYLFLEETDYFPSMAIAPTYVFPTGNSQKGLGNGRGWYFIPIWMQKAWKQWTIYGGGGRAINSGKEEKNYWFGGVVVQREFNDKWTLGVELYGQGDQAVDEKSFTLLNVGGYYAFKKDFSLLFSIGESISGEKNVFAFLGFQWEW